MIRAYLDEIVVFLLPFALFAVVLLLRRRNVLRVESWSTAWQWLVACGLLLVLGSLVGTVLFTERPQSGFEPTHIENGRVVPGRFR